MENELDPPYWLTLRETAKLLHMHPRTIQRLIYHKDLPAKKVRKQWRVRAQQLAEWIRELD